MKRDFIAYGAGVGSTALLYLKTKDIDPDGNIICPRMEIRDCKAHDLIFIMESRQLLPAALDRIEELEQALCESEARSLHNFMRCDQLRDAFMMGETTWVEGPSWDDLTQAERNIRIDFARKWPKAEGRL